MQWTLDIHLDQTEVEASRDYYLSSGRVMGLTNDLYSWTVERTESADRERTPFGVVAGVTAT